MLNVLLLQILLILMLTYWDISLIKLKNKILHVYQDLTITEE
jgi:hypothetical protein